MKAKKINNGLKALRDKEFSRLAGDLDDGRELNSIYATVCRIEKITNLLKTTEPSKFFQWATFFIAVVVIASALWLIKIPKNNIRIRIDADAVVLRTEGWSPQESLSAEELRFAYINDIEAFGIDLEIRSDSGDAWLELEGAKLVFGDLKLGDGTQLTLEVDQSSLNLYTNEGELSALIEFKSGRIDAGPEPGISDLHWKEKLDVYESISVKALGNSAVPTQIAVHSKEKWKLSRIKISGLSFSKDRELAPEPGLFESSLKGGIIVLTDIKKKIEAIEHDNLILRGIESRRFEVIWDRQILRVFFEGSVSGILFGPEGLERDLRPSILEYLYYRKSVIILWGCITFLWGILWGIRKILTT